MKNITHADKQFFEMFGFLIIRNVLSRPEIKLIEKEYDYGFKKTLEHHSNGFGMRKQFNWSNLNEMCPNLCSLPYQKNILRIDFKEKGLSTLKPRKVWFDETINRLNVEEKASAKIRS